MKKMISLIVLLLLSGGIHFSFLERDASESEPRSSAILPDVELENEPSTITVAMPTRIECKPGMSCSSRDQVKAKKAEAPASLSDPQLVSQPASLQATGATDQANMAALFKEQSKPRFQKIKQRHKSFDQEARDPDWAVDKETELLELLSNHQFFSEHMADYPECRSRSCKFSLSQVNLAENEYKKILVPLAYDLYQSEVLRNFDLTTSVDTDTGEINVLLTEKTQG